MKAAGVGVSGCAQGRNAKHCRALLLRSRLQLPTAQQPPLVGMKNITSPLHQPSHEPSHVLTQGVHRPDAPQPLECSGPLENDWRT